MASRSPRSGENYPLAQGEGALPFPRSLRRSTFRLPAAAQTLTRGMSGLGDRCGYGAAWVVRRFLPAVAARIGQTFGLPSLAGAVCGDGWRGKATCISPLLRKSQVAATNRGAPHGQRWPKGPEGADVRQATRRWKQLRCSSPGPSYPQPLPALSAPPPPRGRLFTPPQLG